jgi:uncharacterized protein (TIGR00156 family)
MEAKMKKTVFFGFLLVVILSSCDLIAEGGPPVSSIADAKNAQDGTPAVLDGTIGSYIGGERCNFFAGNDSIQVEIDDEWWRGPDALKEGFAVTIYGEVDKEWGQTTYIDVNRVIKKSGSPVSNTHSVETALDGTPVALEGMIGSNIGGERCNFSAGTDSIQVEIDDEWWRGPNALKEGDAVTIYGEVEREWGEKPYIDVNQVVKKSEKPVSDISSAENALDDTPVVLEGIIGSYIGGERCNFSTRTGNIQVEIDDEWWRGPDALKEGDAVTIYGEVEKKWGQKTYIDADQVVKIAGIPVTNNSK